MSDPCEDEELLRSSMLTVVLDMYTGKTCKVVKQAGHYALSRQQLQLCAKRAQQRVVSLEQIWNKMVQSKNE
jgi:hypothetical protein